MTPFSLLPATRASRFRRIAAAACLLALGMSFAVADVRLAPLFSDGAVLQQHKPVAVWGFADPGEAVEVTFAAQSARTTADKDGRWAVSLQPMKASTTPQTLTVSGKNTINVSDVLVGEVWLCSGQSNMAWDVKRSSNAAREIAQANYPAIREFRVKPNVGETPLNSAAGQWQSASPQTVRDFTAAGYFFAVAIYKQLGVPVGLINASRGDTQIESWINAEALATTSSSAAILQRWQQRLDAYPTAVEKHNADTAQWQADRAQAQAEGKAFTRPAPRQPEGPGSRWQPSGLFNGMIAPLAPYTIAGVLWYQGESNASRHSEYAELFQTLIKQWRGSFQQQNLPFYFVQLANYQRRTEWEHLRQAQADALTLPHTGMAVAIDIGEANNIHPGNKQEVGRRLALLALRDLYGQDVAAQGPRFKGVSFNGDRATVRFSHANGLNSDGQPLTGFAIAGSDRQFHPAQAQVEGDHVILSTDAVQKPVAVRYAWDNDPNPPATLRNAAQLPAEPFRTDSW